MKFSTREEVRNLVQIASIWVFVSTIAVGMILSVAVTVMPVGIHLVVGSIAILGCGWVLSWLLPCLGRYRTVVCPYCGKKHEVCIGEREFCCSNCYGLVRVKSHENGSPSAMLTLVLPRRKSARLLREGSQYAKKLG